eukprot:COSAG06_NODE_719_length_12828_cov_24.153036_4_plen_203_part_00
MYGGWSLRVRPDFIRRRGQTDSCWHPRDRHRPMARHTPFVDNRDGTFSAVIPPEWISRTCNALFHFTHNGEDFHPSATAGDEQWSAKDCPDSPTEGQVECKGLRTVNFMPRVCAPTSHTVLRPALTASACSGLSQTLPRPTKRRWRSTISAATVSAPAADRSAATEPIANAVARHTTRTRSESYGGFADPLSIRLHGLELVW